MQHESEISVSTESVKIIENEQPKRHRGDPLVDDDSVTDIAKRAKLLDNMEVKSYEDIKELHEGSTMFSLQGKRPTNEDRTIIASFGDLEMFAVLDGHRGTDVVDFLKTELPKALLPEFYKREKDSFNIEQCEGIVREIFRDLDLKIFNEKFKAGSCALIALYDKSTNELWTINLGDSQGILFSENSELVLTTSSHSITSESEIKRIKESGGNVTEGLLGIPRVNGDLAVSRAFGDRDLKMTSGRYSPNRGPVSVFPALDFIHLDFNDTTNFYLLLSCDGFWFDYGIKEKLKIEQLMTMVTKDNMSAEKLAMEAFNRGSNDNISVILVKLSK